MGWKDLVDEHDTETGVGGHAEGGPYFRAREMAQYFRKLARLISASARGLALLFLAFGVVIPFLPDGNLVLGFLMLLPAVAVWMLPKPLSIIYGGLGDLIDAHLDMVERETSSGEKGALLGKRTVS